MPGLGLGLRRRPQRRLRASLTEQRHPGAAIDAGPAGRSRRLPGAVAGPGMAAAEGPRRILLVDDQDDILDSLRLYLESALPGVEVLVAPSAREGLQVLGESRVDLVITDLRMPEMNGLEFIHELRRSAQDVPVFLMTAYVQSELAAEARESREFQEFIAKPIDGGRLVALARGYLGS